MGEASLRRARLHAGWKRDKSHHETPQVLGDFRIGFEGGETSRRGNVLAAFDHRFGPEFESLGRVQHRLIQRIASGDAARQIGKPDADGLALLLFNDGDAVGHAKSIAYFKSTEPKPSP